MEDGGVNMIMANDHEIPCTARSNTNQEEKDMAFVNEYIPEEEKAKFTFSVHTDRNGFKPTLRKWTVDRDRNAFLVFTDSEGGGYEGTPITKHFVLSWAGELIHLSAAPSPCFRDEKGGVVKPWRLHDLRIPPALTGQRDEVLQLIRDAFRTMGDLYDGDQYTAVNVHFDLPSTN